MKPTLQFCAEPVNRAPPPRPWKESTGGRNIKPPLRLDEPFVKGRPLSAVHRPTYSAKPGPAKQADVHSRDKFKSPATRLTQSHQKSDYRNNEAADELSVSQTKSININLSNNDSKAPSVAKLRALSKKKNALQVRRKRPPSTFGGADDDDIRGKYDSPLKRIHKMNAMEQRSVSKNYMAVKSKEIKGKYQSQQEICARFNELLKMVKINEVTVNIDTLTGQKIDPRVTGIIFAELAIISRVEITSDKTNPGNLEKLYAMQSKRQKAKAEKASGSTVSKKVSQNTFDTLLILDGLGRNMRQQPVPNSDTVCGSNLRYIHIMNMRINSIGWQALAKGLESTYSVLETLKINLVDFDRESLSKLADGVKKNLSISCLDLSYNNLKDSFGDIIAQIISAQTQSRDQVKWKKGLRLIDIAIQ